MREIDTPITRAEHEEFRRTVEAEFDNLTSEDRRINKRLEALERVTEQINNLARSVDRLTANIATMCETQEAAGKRLTALESRDGEKWRSVVNYMIAGVVGALITALTAYFTN